MRTMPWACWGRTAALIRSLRYVEPVSSFRSTFAYTNVTHVVAGGIVAKVADLSDWNAVLQKELLDPLGMKETSYTAAAIEAAPNHASGYRWTPEGTSEVPFTQIFPYDFDGAGDITHYRRRTALAAVPKLANGAFEGHRIVSTENLAATRTPKVAMSDKVSYALGWVIQQTPNGTIVWHNGGTTGFGSYFGFVSEKNVGVVVLSNEVNIGLPDALGRWVLDRLLGNPKSIMLRTRSRRPRPGSRSRSRHSRSLTIRNHPHRWLRWPGIGSIRAGARPLWPRKATRLS